MTQVERAYALGRFLLAWHQRYGPSRSENLADPARLQYLETLDRLSSSPMLDEQLLRAVAEAQRSGAFEWAYPIEPPLALWREVVHSDRTPPVNLGAVAGLL